MRWSNWKTWLVAAAGLSTAATMLRSLRSRRSAPPTGDRTARIAAHYDAMASKYDPMMRVFDRLMLRDGRRWATSYARGDVLEYAVGTGRNLPCYRDDVRLTAIDVSPAMLELARQRARQLGVHADIRHGDAQALTFPDASFDTVLSTLSMCTIPDERQAIAEAKRVLRPGGRIVLVEHVGSHNRVVRAVQRILDPLSVRVACDHLLRQPADAVVAEGFAIEQIERSRLGIIERLVASKPR